MTFGSAGVGTTPHLAGELFRVRTGIQALHIPYRGAAQSMPALMAGDTDFAIDNIASYTPLARWPETLSRRGGPHCFAAAP